MPRAAQVTRYATFSLPNPSQRIQILGGHSLTAFRPVFRFQRSPLASLIFLVIVAVSSFNNAFAQSPALAGGAMLECSGLPCVDVTLATGKHLRLLVDTGDVDSVLDKAVAKDLGLDVAAVNGGDGKPIAGYGRSVLAGAKIGNGALGDVKVLVMDWAADVKRDRLPLSDGSLAYTAFKDRLLEMDYVKRRVRFSEKLTSEVACPRQSPAQRKCGTLTLPTFGKKGPPIVVATGFSVNQKPITAQIDTLFSGTMLIYPTSVEKLDLSNEARSEKKRFFNYTDDGVDMMEASAKTESFGEAVLARDAPLYFAGPAVHLPDGMFDGTVGHALFEHSMLTLDFHDMKVWME